MPLMPPPPHCCHYADYYADGLAADGYQMIFAAADYAPRCRYVTMILRYYAY